MRNKKVKVGEIFYNRTTHKRYQITSIDRTNKIYLKEYGSKKKELFMYLGHGSNDEVINVNLAKMSYEYFTTNKFDNVKYTEFEMGHTICAQELNEVNDFIYMNAIKHYI